MKQQGEGWNPGQAVPPSADDSGSPRAGRTKGPSVSEMCVICVFISVRLSGMQFSVLTHVSHE